MQILFCDTSGVVRVFYLIKTFLNILRFIIPLGLIVMLSIDLYKNMLLNNPDDKQTIIKKAGNRIIAAIIVFLVPTLINLTMTLISKIGFDTDNYFKQFSSCYDEASLNLVKRLEKDEELKLSKENEEKRKKNLLLVAEMKAKQAAIRENNLKSQRDLNSGVSQNGSYSSNLTDLNKQGGVYVKNGVFYIPNGPSGKGCPSNPTAQGYNNKFGYNNHFYTMLTKLKNAAKQAGYDLGISSQGCRHYATQEEYYKTMEKGRAAKPGNSRHGWGIASDVTFYKNSNTTCGSSRTRNNCPGMAWVHDNAHRFGLHFPLLNASYREDWHIEPINLKKY